MKKQFTGLHIDFIGFVTSLICAIHCVTLPFLLSIAPLMWLDFLENPRVEYSIILLSFVIASFALVKGYIRYHKKPFALIIVSVGFVFIILGRLLQSDSLEIILTTSGAVTISVAHLINWKFKREVQDHFADCLADEAK